MRESFEVNLVQLKSFLITEDILVLSIHLRTVSTQLYNVYLGYLIENSNVLMNLSCIEKSY